MTSGFVEVPIDEGAHPELDNYKKLNGGLMDRLWAAAEDTKGRTIIHINATAKGGGVAEMLKSQVPIERGLGMNSKWLTIKAPEEFFVVTKKIHNLLQGKGGHLSEEEKELYLKVNEELGRSFSESEYAKKGGVLLIHDPQPLAMISHIPKNFACAIRLHIDLSTPNESTLDFLKPFLFLYPRIILTNDEYKKPFSEIDDSKLLIIPPAINPFSDKNKQLMTEQAKEIIATYGINIDKPIVSQVSRFDPWKDPMGAIDVYYKAKNVIPDLQLILPGIIEAADDPEAKELFEHVKKHAKGDPDIFLFAHPDQLKDCSLDIFINAVQAASNIVLQMSIREGFGLTVTEAMWKSKPVIAGNTVGTRMQISDGKNGFLIASHEEATLKLIELIGNPELAVSIGTEARESVREHFLIPKMILNHLQLYGLLLNDRSAYPTFSQESGGMPEVI